MRLTFRFALFGLLWAGIVEEGRAASFHVSPFNTYYDQFTGANGDGTTVGHWAGQ
jgi:hypothetical protein